MSPVQNRNIAIIILSLLLVVSIIVIIVLAVKQSKKSSAQTTPQNMLVKVTRNSPFTSDSDVNSLLNSINQVYPSAIISTKADFDYMATQSVPNQGEFCENGIFNTISTTTPSNCTNLSAYAVGYPKLANECNYTCDTENKGCIGSSTGPLVCWDNSNGNTSNKVIWISIFGVTDSADTVQANISNNVQNVQVQVVYSSSTYL